MTSENVTIRERILLHLNRFPGLGPDEIYNIPFDLTQDGIASVMGISRAHTSLEMKKLRDAGKADEWLAHIVASGTKRKAYYLLPEGKNEAEQLKERFKAKGISVDALLDMKRCDPDVMWENLSAKDKDTFGLACTFRVPIPRKSIPDTNTGVIPADYDGNITISENVARKYLALAAPDKLKMWNSQAADWWGDNGDDIQERLFHLSRAGRNIEACKFLVKNADDFIDNSNEDLLAIIKEIQPIPKIAEGIYAIRAKVALSCADQKDALFCADRLDEFKSADSALIRAEVRMLADDAKGAYADAEAIFKKNESAKAALIAARALVQMKRADEAAVFLDSAYKKLVENGDATSIDDLLILKAGVAFGRGKKDDCISYLNKALKVCKNDKRKARVKTLIAEVNKGSDVRF